VHVIVDLPAVRPPRLADRVVVENLAELRDFRELLSGAHATRLPRGVRLAHELDVRAIARLADLVRDAADGFPFWTFRLLADPPRCRLEITGTGRAGDLAYALFGELGRD